MLLIIRATRCSLRRATAPSRKPDLIPHSYASPSLAPLSRSSIFHAVSSSHKSTPREFITQNYFHSDPPSLIFNAVIMNVPVELSQREMCAIVKVDFLYIFELKEQKKR